MIQKDAIVSVIITTYKRNMAILERSILTVLNQTEKRIELIIVNDFPEYEDDIRKLLIKYPQVILISHKINMGANKSRNDGLHFSHGKYIAYLDDDDEWKNNKIEKQIKLLEKTQADMVYCTGDYYWNDGKIERSPLIKKIPDNVLEELLKSNYMGGCSFPMFKKEFILQLGGFDEDLPSSQDYDMWIRIAERGKIVYLDESLVKYYVNNDSISSDFDKRIKGYYLLLEKFKNLYMKYPSSLLCFYENMATNAIGYRRWDIYIKVFIDSFICFPKNYQILLVPFRIVFNGLKRRILKLIWRSYE